MSLLGTLNTAVSGMNASQVGIDTTSHNLSNVNTPGYVRQRVELQASRPLSQQGGLSVGQVGTGVTVSGIERIKNTFYDYQFRSENTTYGETLSKYSYLSNLETIFNEPSDSSLSTTINNFFNSIEGLTKDPNSLSEKNIVVENSKHLTDTLNKLSNSIDNLSQSCTKEQNDLLNEVNTQLKEVKELEKQINIIKNTGSNPNDLMDSMDKLLDSLSSKIDLKNPNLEAALKDGELSLEDIKNFDIKGSIKGLIDVQEQISGYTTQLETLMTNITNQVNQVYKSDLPNEAHDFFTLVEQDGKKVMGVDEYYTQKPESLTMTSAKAQKLIDIKDAQIDIGGNKITIPNYYLSIVQDIGQSTQNLGKLEENQSKYLNSINAERWNVAGVSLDEEMVNLVQYQHAYNASAKVISTVDSLLDVVINGLIR